jgi:hypothetical protein
MSDFVTRPHYTAELVFQTEILAERLRARIAVERSAGRHTLVMGVDEAALIQVRLLELSRLGYILRDYQLGRHRDTELFGNLLHGPEGPA